MRQVLNIFQFWGAGNIGDDLMLAGFLSALEGFEVVYEGRLSGLSSFDVSSQQIRFPKIRWIDCNAVPHWDGCIAQAELIVGIGDTPFQLTCGEWFLAHLRKAFALIRPGAEVIFVNVGAEKEIVLKAGEFAGILRQIRRCSTRDVLSHSILRGLSEQMSTELSIGGDLANISLAELVKSTNSDRKFPIGLILGYDTLSKEDIAAVRSFLEQTRGPIAFITGDCRDGAGFEYELFRLWTKNWLSGFRKRLILRRPNYRSGSLAELVQPVAECELLLSSRFHGLLAGAWFGCRVAALARSSKVVALAEELGIPYLTPPFRAYDIQRLVTDAACVPRVQLEQQRRRAFDGVMACKCW